MFQVSHWVLLAEMTYNQNPGSGRLQQERQTGLSIQQGFFVFYLPPPNPLRQQIRLYTLCQAK